MKNKMLLFVRMFIDNAAVLKAHKASILLALLILIINVALISVPNYVGVYRGADTVITIENIRVAFNELIDDEVNCEINEVAIMTCVSPYQDTYGDYRFVWTEDEINLDDILVSSIVFSPTHAAVVHITNPGEDNERIMIVTGSFSLITGFNFSTIAEKADEAEDRAVYIEEVTEFFLRNLYMSQINIFMMLVFVTQFGQTFLYLMFVSVFFLILNYRAKFKKITLPASFKIAVFAMTGPALLTALVGLLIPMWASIVFLLVYLGRIIMIYYRVNSVEETLV